MNKTFALAGFIAAVSVKFTIPLARAQAIAPLSCTNGLMVCDARAQKDFVVCKFDEMMKVSFSKILSGDTRACVEQGEHQSGYSVMRGMVIVQAGCSLEFKCSTTKPAIAGDLPKNNAAIPVLRAGIPELDNSEPRPESTHGGDESPSAREASATPAASARASSSRPKTNREFVLAKLGDAYEALSDEFVLRSNASFGDESQSKNFFQAMGDLQDLMDQVDTKKLAVPDDHVVAAPVTVGSYADQLNKVLVPPPSSTVKAGGKSANDQLTNLTASISDLIKSAHYKSSTDKAIVQDALKSLYSARNYGAENAQPIRLSAQTTAPRSNLAPQTTQEMDQLLKLAADHPELDRSQFYQLFYASPQASLHKDIYNQGAWGGFAPSSVFPADKNAAPPWLQSENIDPELKAAYLGHLSAEDPIFKSYQSNVPGDQLNAVKNGLEKHSFSALFLSAAGADPKSFQFKAFNFPKGGETFTMGSQPNESGRHNDEVQHKVTLTKSFEMQVTPVTQLEWEKVMGSNPSNFKGPNRPVESVSWNDVQEFINKLNAKDPRYHYSLPTEAEWEYAARAHTTTAYSFGDDSSKLGEYGWYSSNSGKHTYDVASLRPNPAGLYDMQGNVWQWVQDWYGDYPSDSVDPTGPSSGSSRVLRGGGWYSVPQSLRSAHRGYDVPSSRVSDLGFRLVRTPN